MSLPNQKLLQRAFQFKSIFFSMLFILYIWLIQPMLMNLLSASQNGTGNFWLGWGLFFVPLFEFAGIYSKLPVSNYFRKQLGENDGNNSALIFAFVINMVLHLGLGCLYLFVCLQIIQGVPLGKGSDLYSTLSVILLFIVIAKEGFIIGVIMVATPLPGINGPANNKYDKWLFEKVLQNRIVQLTFGDFIQDTAGDGFLFLFTAISFTVMWNFIVSLNPPDIYWPKEISELSGVLIYFLMIYLPLRASSFPFEMNMIQNKKQWLLYVCSIFLAAIIGILPFIK